MIDGYQVSRESSHAKGMALNRRFRSFFFANWNAVLFLRQWVPYWTYIVAWKEARFLASECLCSSSQNTLVLWFLSFTFVPHIHQTNPWIGLNISAQGPGTRRAHVKFVISSKSRARRLLLTQRKSLEGGGRRYDQCCLSFVVAVVRYLNIRFPSSRLAVTQRNHGARNTTKK